jgi:hypothetical protein
MLSADLFRCTFAFLICTTLARHRQSFQSCLCPSAPCCFPEEAWRHDDVCTGRLQTPIGVRLH